jgi:hypothetical protein
MYQRRPSEGSANESGVNKLMIRLSADAAAQSTKATSRRTVGVAEVDNVLQEYGRYSVEWPFRRGWALRGAAADALRRTVAVEYEDSVDPETLGAELRRLAAVENVETPAERFILTGDCLV